jgi:GntR family transcriptional regulator
VFESIDPRSPTPLYEQIAARVRIAVSAGELEPGEALPSVRVLARDLRVNPATVVQAYRDLAIDGFVEIRHGQGTFVQYVPRFQREEERTSQAEKLVRKLIQDAGRLGISAEEIARVLAAEVGVDVRE